MGAKTIVTSSSDDKLAKMKALGAGETINYRNTTDWDAAVLEMTGGVGVDRVVEVGGPGTFDKSGKRRPRRRHCWADRHPDWHCSGQAAPYRNHAQVSNRARYLRRIARNVCRNERGD